MRSACQAWSLLLVPHCLAALVAMIAGTSGCTEKKAPVHERTLFFRGEPVAQIEERVEDEGQGKRIQRKTRLPSGEIVEMNAVLDSFGYVREAHYRRGEGARRSVDVDGVAHTISDGNATISLSAVPIVVVELQHHVHPPNAVDVELVDLASGEALPGNVRRQGATVVISDGNGGAISRCNVEGQCTGPGAFFEGSASDTAPSLDVAPVEPALVANAAGKPRALRLVGINEAGASLARGGPGQRAGDAINVEYVDDALAMPAEPSVADRAPSLFIESNDPSVKQFAGTPGEALADATRIADAVFPLVDASLTDTPPSAKSMLKNKGDCDGAAALVVASMRALGHAARPAVGYKLVASKFVPHAWAEVHTPSGWVIVDATVPRVGGAAIANEYLKLFPGLGSSLTMGRVLGRLRVEPAVPAAAAEK